jgi:cyclophilin family peptidyl-prolyl cis-trans isomerase
MPAETLEVLNSLYVIVDLDRNHTCFGKVIEGLDVIDAIRPMDTINSISIID